MVLVSQNHMNFGLCHSTPDFMLILLHKTSPLSLKIATYMICEVKFYAYNMHVY
jgi:hypothetical protein